MSTETRLDAESQTRERCTCPGMDYENRALVRGNHHRSDCSMFVASREQKPVPTPSGPVQLCPGEDARDGVPQ